MERPLPDTARKLYIRLTHRLFDVWHSYHLLVTCVYIRHFTIGKQPGLTVITYCRGSIPLIHAILFSRLHCQLRKLYWSLQGMLHAVIQNWSRRKKMDIWYLITSHSMQTLYDIFLLVLLLSEIKLCTLNKDALLKDIPQCNTVKLDYGKSLGFSLSEIR